MPAFGATDCETGCTEATTVAVPGKFGPTVGTGSEGAGLVFASAIDAGVRVSVTAIREAGAFLSTPAGGATIGSAEAAFECSIGPDAATGGAGTDATGRFLPTATGGFGAMGETATGEAEMLSSAATGRGETPDVTASGAAGTLSTATTGAGEATVEKAMDDAETVVAAATGTVGTTEGTVTGVATATFEEAAGSGESTGETANGRDEAVFVAATGRTAIGDAGRFVTDATGAGMMPSATAVGSTGVTGVDTAVADGMTPCDWTDWPAATCAISGSGSDELALEKGRFASSMTGICGVVTDEAVDVGL